MSRPRYTAFEREAAHTVSLLPNDTCHNPMIIDWAALLTILGYDMGAWGGNCLADRQSAYLLVCPLTCLSGGHP